MSRLSGKFQPMMFALLLVLMLIYLAIPVQAQDATPRPDERPPEVPPLVEIQPEALDDAIETRLEEIFNATGWFINPDVTVRDGVVFLTGEAQSMEFKDWAGNLARNTQDVAAVVNQMDVTEPPLLDFDPLLNGLRDQSRSIMPDEAREMIFPQGVPVTMVEAGTTIRPIKQQVSTEPPVEDDTISTNAEGGLRSEAGEIEHQARYSRTPEPGENLLKNSG